MKERKISYIILTLVISIISPFVLSLIIQIVGKLGENLGLGTFFIFENVNVMTYTDYLSTIISILTLMTSLWIGINTYNISCEIKKHEEEKERRDLEKAKKIIIKEIEKNTKIIKKYNGNIDSSLQNLQVQGQEEISKLILYTNVTNSDLIINLSEIYRLYSELKNNNIPSKIIYDEKNAEEISKRIEGLKYEQT